MTKSRAFVVTMTGEVAYRDGKFVVVKTRDGEPARKQRARDKARVAKGVARALP